MSRAGWLLLGLGAAAGVAGAVLWASSASAAAPPPGPGPGSAPGPAPGQAGSEGAGRGADPTAVARGLAQDLNEIEAKQKYKAEDTLRAGDPGMYKTVNTIIDFGASFPLVGPLIKVFAEIGRSLETGARVGPNVDVLGEALRRLPPDVQARMYAGARRLPPWPNEANLKGPAGPAPEVIVLNLRLVQEARKQGIWPGDTNQRPDGTVIASAVEAQLKALAQVGLAAAQGAG